MTSHVTRALTLIILLSALPHFIRTSAEASRRSCNPRHHVSQNAYLHPTRNASFSRRKKKYKDKTSRNLVAIPIIATSPLGIWLFHYTPLSSLRQPQLSVLHSLLALELLSPSIFSFHCCRRRRRRRRSRSRPYCRWQNDKGAVARGQRYYRFRFGTMRPPLSLSFSFPVRRWCRGFPPMPLSPWFVLLKTARVRARSLFLIDYARRNFGAFMREGKEGERGRRRLIFPGARSLRLSVVVFGRCDAFYEYPSVLDHSWFLRRGWLDKIRLLLTFTCEILGALELRIGLCKWTREYEMKFYAFLVYGMFRFYQILCSFQKNK